MRALSRRCGSRSQVMVSLIIFLCYIIYTAVFKRKRLSFWHLITGIMNVCVCKPLADANASINGISLISPGAFFTPALGVGIRGYLSQTKNTEIWIKQSDVSAHSITPFFFFLVWHPLTRRLQPRRVGSIAIALQGNLVCLLWISPIVVRHGF